MKRILPILTLLIILSIVILLPHNTNEVPRKQVLSVETAQPTPKSTPIEDTKRDQENFGSFLVPKDLQ